jgi:uncharacterized protein YbjT (DUF2867 family)
LALHTSYKEAIMIIAVFGATGDTGRLVVEYALQEGHKVQVLARDPKKLPNFKVPPFNL